MKQTGDDYFDSEEFRDLLAQYEDAKSAGEPVFLDADELAEVADYYQITEQYEDAEDAISLALSLSPGAIAPLTYRIHEALYNGDIQAAWNLFDQIVEKDDPDYIYDRAEILIAEGRVEEADNYLREQFKSVPLDEYQDYVVDVANIFSEYNQNDKALEWMARAKHEDSPDFKELMGRTLFGLGKYKDSQRIFNELIDTNPFSKYYWNALASAQFMDEDYENAIKSSEYAIAIDPTDPDGLLSKANGLYYLNNYEEALKYYRRYSEQEPNDEFALMHQGTCLVNMEQSEEAAKMLQHALDVADSQSPYLCDIYQELAFAHSEMGHADIAIDYLNKTDELDCDHIQIGVIKGHVMLAAGMLSEAEEQYRQAVVKSDTPNQTLLRVIVSLYDNRFLDASYALLKHYMETVPTDNTDGYAYMALCCFDLKKYDEFLKYLKKACKVNPKECKMVLNHLFPEELAPEDYYEYIKGKCNNKDMQA